MNGHQSDIIHRRLENPVAAHFNSENHTLEDLSVFVKQNIRREEANNRRGNRVTGLRLSDRWPQGDSISIHSIGVESNLKVER